MDVVKSSAATVSVVPLSATLKLVNDRLHFVGQAGTHPPINLDYVPPFGDNLGYTPLELFLVSLGTCAASSVLVLLRKMGKTITGLEVKASGIRREQHPTAFETITLDFLLKSPDTEQTSFDKAITLSEDSICPVWAMIKNNVRVIVNSRIEKD